MSLWQRCPNCREAHDVSVYVSGQRVSCKRCALRFEVIRPDVPSSPPPRESTSTAPARPGTGAIALIPEPTAPPAMPPPAPLREVFLEPTATGNAPALAAAAAARHATLGPSSPRQLPGFELLDLLGRGGMGEVWRARQLSLGREVAVKILSPELAQDPDFIRRFELEASALTNLSHPHVVAIIDRARHEGLLYFAMEFIPGKSLRERLSAGPLPVEEAVRLVGQVLLALGHAHKKGIVHRDLKPENVLLAEHNGLSIAKVADFGLAAMAGATGPDRITKSSVAMGTLSYMAPEQRRDAHTVDFRADLYSTGVVLYELLTGDVPAGRFELPSKRRAGIPKGMDRVVERALAPEASDRFSTALEMATALSSVADRRWFGEGWVKFVRGR